MAPTDPWAQHGGVFWDEHTHVQDLHSCVRADVLDAWFPPGPEVVAVLRTSATEFANTTPPEDSTILKGAISAARGLDSKSILCHAGSSALIYSCFRELVQRSSRVLVLDPTYGEYEHVATKAGRPVTRIPLPYPYCAASLLKSIERELMSGDLFALVNPNSPTGTVLPSEALKSLMNTFDRTTFWVDETYSEYVDQPNSLERVASAHHNLIVCKSMSKVYALSGLRVGYAVSLEERIAEFRGLIPPWAVCLPAQLAGEAALRSTGYYRERYIETHQLRSLLCRAIEQQLGWPVQEGAINCVLTFPNQRPDEIVATLRKRGVYIRSGFHYGGREALRIAVRSAPENARTVGALSAAANVRTGR